MREQRWNKTWLIHNFRKCITTLVQTETSDISTKSCMLFLILICHRAVWVRFFYCSSIAQVPDEIVKPVSLITLRLRSWRASSQFGGKNCFTKLIELFLYDPPCVLCFEGLQNQNNKCSENILLLQKRNTKRFLKQVEEPGGSRHIIDKITNCILWSYTEKYKTRKIRKTPKANEGEYSRAARTLKDRCMGDNTGTANKEFVSSQNYGISRLKKHEITESRTYVRSLSAEE